MTMIVKTIFILHGFLGTVLSQMHHDICAEIMLVDCNKEALPGNKLYRDNHGIIYDNFCLYSQAKCKDKSLDIDAVCTCVDPAFAAQTSGSQTTQGPVVTTAAPQTTAPVTLNRETPPTTTPLRSTTLMPIIKTTTPDPASFTTGSDQLVSLFCKNKDIISCPSQQDPVCGSNGITYNNRCEFAKGQCTDPSIAMTKEGPC